MGAVNAAVLSPRERIQHSNYKLWCLGGEGGEVYFHPRGWNRGESRRPSRGGCLSTDREENQLRACRRARGEIRRLVAAHCLTYLWSLTFAENITDLDIAWGIFGLFQRRLRRRFPGIKLLGVPERQKSGRWHFHCAVDRWVDHGEVEGIWGRGFVWQSKHREERGVSRYLVKYVSKAFAEVPAGHHRYRRSRNMPIETHEGVAEDFLEALEQMEALKGGPVEVLAFSHDMESGYWWAQTYCVERTEADGSDGRRCDREGGT